MKTALARTLALTAALLSSVTLAHANSNPLGGSATYNPPAYVLQGNQPLNTATSGTTDSITITAPGGFLSLTPIPVTQVITLIGPPPAGVTVATALSFLTIKGGAGVNVSSTYSANSITVTGMTFLPGQSRVLNVDVSVPLGNYAGNYTYQIHTQWPTNLVTDLLGSLFGFIIDGTTKTYSTGDGTTINATINGPLPSNSPPVVAFQFPTQLSYVYDPSTGIPVSVSIAFTGNVAANGGAIDAQSLTVNGAPVTLTSSSGVGTLSSAGTATFTTSTPGTYTILASAHNSAGFGTQPLSVVVNVLTSKPSITVTAPINNPTYTYTVGGTPASVSVPVSVSSKSTYGNIISLTAVLTAPDGTTSPLNLNPVGVNTSLTATGNPPNLVLSTPGTYTITFTSSNPYGTAVTAQSFTVVAQAPLPTISISNPLNLTTYVIPAGSSVASVPYAITGGVIYGPLTSQSATLNGGGTSVPVALTVATSGAGTSVSANGSFSLTAGSYTLSAADANSAGNASASVNFIVVGTPPPTITITAPANGATVGLAQGAATATIPYSIAGGVTYGTLTSESAVLTGTGISAPGTTVSLTTAASGQGTSLSGNGSFALGAGTYTLTAADANGVGASSASVTFTVTMGPPVISITAPTNGSSITIPSGATTASVPYTITGSAASGTVVSASATLSGLALSPAATFGGLGTGSISASGTLSLAAGTYTLAATDSNSSGTGTASVTFTVVASTTGGGQTGGGTVNECLVWLQTNCGNSCYGSGWGNYGDCNHWSSCNQWDNNSQSNKASQTVCGGSVVPIVFGLYTCTTNSQNNCNNNNYYSNNTFVKDTATVIAIYDASVSGSPTTMYTYGTSGPTPPNYSIGNEQYLLNFPTAAGTHHYVVSIYHSFASGSPQLLGTQDLYTQGSCMPATCSNTSNFNGTPVAAGRCIWFNSIVKCGGLGGNTSTLYCDASTISFPCNGKTVTLNCPAGSVQFSANCTTATTTYNSAANCWVTVVPVSYSGNVFLTGLCYQVPAGYTTGVNVTWNGCFRTDTDACNPQWQWAAAVYSSCPSSLTGFGVKPCDDNKLSQYQNSDHAGTPESCKSNVVGGARGGGGSNYTGSYSGTCTPNAGSSCWLFSGCDGDNDGCYSGDDYNKNDDNWGDGGCGGGWGW